MSSTPLFKTVKSLILASASPRRQKMLRKLGIEFSIAAAHINETPLALEKPKDFAIRMASDKARVIAQKNPATWIIGADTVVCLADCIFGKPRDDHDALKMLRQLVGRTHEVITGICLRNAALDIETAVADRTEVTFNEATDDMLEAYIRSGEPLDKAGAYGIQGSGSFLIRSINGSCSNVIGLPMNVIIRLLLQQKIIATRTEQNSH